MFFISFDKNFEKVEKFGGCCPLNFIFCEHIVSVQNFYYFGFYASCLKIPSDMAPSKNIEEYLCPICRDILILPVKLPCKHTCCNECLEQTLDSNKYQCFMCRKFIGSWYRNAKRKKTLINEKLWKFIKDKFGDVVDKKLSGESVGNYF